jgi:hypothetical protein
MSDQVSKFESQRQQVRVFCFVSLPLLPYFILEFVTGLEEVAESLRSCAKFADAFARVVADTPYSPDTAALLQGTSPIRLVHARNQHFRRVRIWQRKAQGCTVPGRRRGAKETQTQNEAKRSQRPKASGIVLYSFSE